MPSRKFHLLLPLSVLLLATVLLLWPTENANAQCGSQASSCKNCHEVQGEDPVNNDGTGWHQSHAFGDFCEFCHAGNVQATEIDAAHTGMVVPLSDVKAGCAACHPDDLMEKAEVYAATLGVEIGAGGGGSVASTGGSSTDSSTAVSTSSGTITAVPVSTEMVVNDPNVIDYVQRYNEIVLGIKPTNWGNIALIALIGAVVIGGGGFVVKNENWLGKESEEMTAVPDGYPEETVALLPQIAKLNDDGRQALNHLLEKPDEAAQLFQSQGCSVLRNRTQINADDADFFFYLRLSASKISFLARTEQP